MSRRTQLIVSLVALVIAAGVGFYVYRTFSQMVTTAEAVTPAQTIPAGALIEPGMLESKEIPRPLLEEDIYVEAGELAGQVAAVPLHPDMVIYSAFAVPQRDYRLVGDPSLEVVSFPVSPERTVGGQLQPGQRVDLWRLATVKPGSKITLTELTARRWATATLLVKNVPVVDVRAASGAAVARQPQAVPGRVAGDEESQSSSTANLQILTVGVPPTVTREILTLVGEETVGLHLWVSLSPLDREGQVTEIAGISREEDASMTPGHPPGLSLERIGGTVRLYWDGTGDDRIERYVIYRGRGSHWRKIGDVPSEGRNEGSYTFSDDDPLPADREVAYGVKAVDGRGSHSGIVKATLPPVSPTPTVPTVTPMAAAPTAEPISTAVISGTDGAPLRVRAQPGGEVIGTLEEGTLVIPLKGPITAGETRWQMVETETLTRTATITETTMITGWVASDYVYVE